MTMITNAMNWNTMCRCCLARLCDKNLKSDNTCLGKTEVYGDMLKECFEIHLSIEPVDSKNGICEICIARLRDASDFKQQVLRCQITTSTDIKVEDMPQIKEEYLDIEENDISALVCRCCLVQPPDKDLKSVYTCLGKTEVYGDMLKECFEIHLSIDPRDSERGICVICIARLRDASDFKQQVLRCQITTSSDIKVMEPRLRATLEQFSLLIDFMERHRDLSKPQPGLQGRIRVDRLWQQLSSILNSRGGGVVKSSDKWKKVWADWKTKTKKKYLNIQRQSSRPGGGPSSRAILTALEERVVAVIGVSAGVGQAGTQEQGFHLENAMEVPTEPLDVVLEGHNSQNIAISTPAWPAGTIPQLEEDAPAPTLSLQPSPLPQLEEDAPAPPPSLPPSPLPQLEEDAPAPPLSVPPQIPPPPLPDSPPAQKRRRRQSSASPSTSTATPRRTSITSRARRSRGLTPFERTANLFANIEERRLVHEEERDKRLHEREMERLRLEAERIVVARQQNELLHQLSLVGQRLIDVITQQPQRSLQQ